MKHFHKAFAVKATALILVLLMTHGNLMVFPQEERLDKLFQWAKMDYNAEKYRDVSSDLELMLSYYDKGTADTSSSIDLKLKGKIYLLLAATYEKLGRLQLARNNYQQAKTLLEKKDLDLGDVVLNDLPEYNRIMQDQPDTQLVVPKIIERPGTKPHKKKRRLLPLIIGGVLIAGVVTAALLLKKKKTVEDINVNFDTQVLGIEWVHIPAGEYVMGDNFNEGDVDEQPVHSIHLKKYHISKYEITFAQIDRFWEDSGRTLEKPSDNGWGRGNRPAINVTWNDAYEFCKWLSKKTGKNIQLSTEAQWEVAARGTGQVRFPWGNTPPDCNKVNYNCDFRTHPVGSHPEGISAFGVHDMAGNVSEWCYDGYLADYYQKSPYENPCNTPTTFTIHWMEYVIRGGSWDPGDIISIRSTDRTFGRYYWYITSVTDDNTKNNHLGFRIVVN